MQKSVDTGRHTNRKSPKLLIYHTSLIISIIFTFAIPAFTFAGTQTYSLPGTYSFTVPAYSSITVEVQGAGGGGGSSTGGEPTGVEFFSGQGGGAGGQSLFKNDLIAGGGRGGRGGVAECSEGGDGGCAIFYSDGTSGADGTAWGGDQNAIGNGSKGGTGGPAFDWSIFGYPRRDGSGGSGGAGGKTTKSYSPSTLGPGSSVIVTVGNGGQGGVWQPPWGTRDSWNCSTSNRYEDYYCYSSDGQAGDNGSVTITWTDASAPTCSVTLDQNPISQGSGTTIHWSSTNADWFYINSIGYVSGSGSAWVQPSQTTNYDGSAGNPGNEVSCPATLTVAPAPQCTPSYSCSGNGIRNSCTGEVTPCPSGATCSGGQCVAITCTPTYSCVGNAVRNSCTKSTISCLQNYTCSNGACIPPPSISFVPFLADGFTASGHLQVWPKLVRPNSSVKVYWNAENISSCSISGTNGEHWEGGFSGTTGKLSSSITQTTTYTLLCHALQGAMPSTITESETVNIIPIFQEL